MLFTTLNGRSQQDVKYRQYLIDWDHKVSGPQKAVKDFLRPYWEHKTVLEEMRIPGSKLRCDIVCLANPAAVIEVSPNQHFQYNAFLHGSLSGFKQSLKRDLQKEKWARLNGFAYVEITDEDLKAGLSVGLFAERGVIL